MPFPKPLDLTTRTLLQVAAAVSLILAAATAGAYFTVLKAMQRQGLEALSEYASERAKRENAGFTLARGNLEVMKRTFLERWAAPETGDPALWVERRMERTADGALRSRRALVDPDRDASTWVRKDVAVTPEMARLMMITSELCERFFPAWETEFLSLYVSSPLDFNTGLAPAEPDWVWEIEADFNQSASEWGGAGGVGRNPSRQPVWTGVVPNFTDPADDDVAYVTLCTPVDVGGRHLLTFHQDLDLARLIRDTAMSERPGVEHAIFRPDGRAIASPRVPPRLIAMGSYKLQDSPDARLRRMHAAAIAHPDLRWAGYDPATDCYIALAGLPEPGWVFASILPGSELRTQAFRSAKWVLWAGLGGLAVALTALALILRRQVAAPLSQLLEMIRRVSAGDTAARVPVTADDELGRIAAAFNQMAENVSERDARLQKMNQELEQRIAERTEGLRQSEERFSRAFHGSHALLAIIDAETGVFLDVNDAFLGTFGHRRDEVIGKNIADLDCWEHPEERDALWRTFTTKGFARGIETAMLSRDGTPRVVLQSGDRVTIGSASCILSVGADITERKQAELETQRALEREKELNQLKDSFVAMISHEFRTPLEMITTSTDILGRYLDRITPEQRRKQLGTIGGAVRRMGSMMEEVLLFSRAEAGRLPCEPQDLHLTAWCRRLVEETNAGAEGREIRLTLDDFPPMVMADERLLRHIFDNLLSNALKYSPADRPVEFHVSRDGVDAVFLIRDHGVGIPPEDQPHLFDGFRRGGNVGQTPGTGLGLVITKRCVELHGGAITFTSRENDGATFTVRLPLFPPTA